MRRKPNCLLSNIDIYVYGTAEKVHPRSGRPRTERTSVNTIL